MSIANTTATKKAAENEPVSIAVATDGIRIPRATSGPVLDLDLITMAEQLRYEAAWSDGRNTRTLVKHADFRLILTVMRPGARLHSHQARGTVLIQVMSGCIRARVLDDIVGVYSGHALSLDPHLEHEIEAVEESALLITIAWPHDLSIPPAAPADTIRVRWSASLGPIAEELDVATKRNAA